MKTKPKEKMVHRAGFVTVKGGMSALCFPKPRAIDLARASWTKKDNEVTCDKCLDIIEINKASVSP